MLWIFFARAWDLDIFVLIIRVRYRLEVVLLTDFV